jgi:hypothetical protein
LVSSRWLRAHNCPSNLVAIYIASGWLKSPARGVYLCKGGRPTRLFLALAERHKHGGTSHLDLRTVDMGRVKHALVRGGKLNAKCRITLPADLDEQLG